jgi:hypothetical protein
VPEVIVALLGLIVLALFIGAPLLVIAVLIRARRKVVPSERDIEPGWYADPSRRYERRYWDGERWTDDVPDDV